MNKKDLKVEITREEKEYYDKCEMFYTAFIHSKDNSMIEHYEIVKTCRGGSFLDKQIYFCQEALDRIESKQLEVIENKLKASSHYVEILKEDIKKLKNRNLIQRILNK